MTQLFHILASSEWARAKAEAWLRPASLGEEGFVHCSFAEQVAEVAARRFSGREGLCVLEIDPGRLGAPVRVEDSHGSGVGYPHVYGPIPVAAVRAVHALTRDSGGDYRFTPRRGTGGASPGR